MNDNHRHSATAKSADRHFRKETKEQEETEAWADYRAGQAATLAKTQRLKELRLARDMSAPKVAPKAGRPTKK
jgi:hypothetical protein